MVSKAACRILNNFWLLVVKVDRLTCSKANLSKMWTHWLLEIHPSLTSHVNEDDSWWQRDIQSIPFVLLPSNTSQFLLGAPGVFQGQRRSSGGNLRVPTNWVCLENLQREMAMNHPYQTSEIRTALLKDPSGCARLSLRLNPGTLQRKPISVACSLFVTLLFQSLPTFHNQR